MQIFPVPSSRKLTVDYAIPKKQKVTIVIYDILGRCLKRLASGMADAGLHRLYWDCRDDLDRKVPSGIYFCRFETRGFAETRKIIVLR
jgi:flagellar hook assembly protein FlgD